MIIIPVVVLAMLFVVQFSLAYYARQVLAGAAHDGAAAGARQDATPEAGAALTEQLINESGNALLDLHSTTASTDGETVTVIASGEVVSLLAFFGTITVSASASAKVESFDPQGPP